MQDVSLEIKRVRAQMEENEELASLMRGLRGQNLKDSLFAEDNVNLRLVEVCCMNRSLYFCLLKVYLVVRLVEDLVFNQVS